MAIRFAALIAFISIVCPEIAHARVLEGPVAARVERVIDGDTLNVRARIWLDQELNVNVRLRGIDAPELRAGCETELVRAEHARDTVIELLGGGNVRLRHIAGGKYHGRVIADVTMEDGRDLADALLAAGVARPYDGGRRGSWCNAAD